MKPRSLVALRIIRSQRVRAVLVGFVAPSRRILAGSILTKRIAQMTRGMEMGHTVRVVAGGTLLFALSHSLLATDWMKRQVEAIFGTRVRNGLYRFVYNNITYASIGALVFAARGLPDRVVYRVPRPWSLLMRAGQLLG